jgi:hypothetical protein
VHFLPKKSEIAPQNRKSGFWRKKCNFRENAANLPKRYLFCFKRLFQNWYFVILGAPGPTSAKFSEFYGISGNSSKFGEIRGISRNFSFLAQKRDSGWNDQNTIKIPL